MALAIFDLDNTLLAGDSDHAWGQFLIDLGVVDREVYAQANDRFYAQYAAGTLDIDEFAAFAYRPLAEHPLADLYRWREAYFAERIAPMILPKGRALIAAHQARGDIGVIITATNRFITEPIAAALGIDHLLATEPALVDGRFQARIAGIPCFQEGKVKRLLAWAAAQRLPGVRQRHDERLPGVRQRHDEDSLTIDDATFYSDSRNDLPLLERVGYPVAVDPDPVLDDHAKARGWPVISLRDDGPVQAIPIIVDAIADA